VNVVFVDIVQNRNALQKNVTVAQIFTYVLDEKY